ncbi:4'-phosphopantetheinyl transferase superfamily protein [Streptococcus sanguinis]|uniref:4'-phosphopantetheinyl transferase family protein n=1 Tax=Streptococcus sanguinis TaxID=1305 RepID=UPI002284D9C5|nr:4'-phosphopantetheinyl transferase superfamily protein [Streptococcus sanguinis]MCY7040019.1 4'-phosphopantetheinyl transferase superfamily protein [Streptococcus sanguinis]
MLNIYYANVKEMDYNNLYDDFFEILSEEKKQKLSSYIFDKNKIQSILSELLVRYGLIHDFGFKKNEINFIDNPFGKPKIEFSSIQYNISHSDDIVICAIGNGIIGIDIEKEEDIDFDNLITFFHLKERLFLESKPFQERKRLFYRMWCAKEAYLKYKGIGLLKSLDSFNIDLEKLIVFDGGEMKVRINCCLLENFEGYSCAVCHNIEGEDLSNLTITKVMSDKLYILK